MIPILDVLIVSGLHLPVKPSLEVDGNIGGLEFWHRRIGVKLGLIWEVISISTDVDIPHSPAVGVKV